MKSKKPLKITSRTSSVTNGFVQAIIPWEKPTRQQMEEALAALDMTFDTIHCCYCGDRATEWDHLRPLVKGKRPTGYISDHRNMVPSCGPCNHSKSGNEWRAWMLGKAKGSPTARGNSDIETRVAALTRFEVWSDTKPLDFATAVGSELWDKYWSELAQIESLMHEAQKTAAAISIALKTRAAP